MRKHYELHIAPTPHQYYVNATENALQRLFALKLITLKYETTFIKKNYVLHVIKSMSEILYLCGTWNQTRNKFPERPIWQMIKHESSFRDTLLVRNDSLSLSKRGGSKVNRVHQIPRHIMNARYETSGKTFPVLGLMGEIASKLFQCTFKALCIHFGSNYEGMCNVSLLNLNFHYV